MGRVDDGARPPGRSGAGPVPACLVLPTMGCRAACGAGGRARAGAATNLLLFSARRNVGMPRHLALYPRHRVVSDYSGSTRFLDFAAKGGFARIVLARNRVLTLRPGERLQKIVRVIKHAGPRFEKALRPRDIRVVEAWAYDE